jgi:nitroreductase
MNLEKAIKTRKSVRNFSVKDVSLRKVLQAIDYARFAPMAGNIYTLKYIIVSEEEKIHWIKEACQQNFIKDAKQVVLVVSDREKVGKMYDHFNKGFGAQQAGAAIQNILLGLTERGLATCWVGLFEESIIKRELKIPELMTVEAILPIGIENKSLKTERKIKQDINNLVFFEKWGKKYLGEDTRQTYANS